MSEKCEKLHKLFNSLPKLIFPFNDREIPDNGIYILFEKGEFGHYTNRIVRIGTHTGQNQLKSRLKQHFENENKDRSIFRKNIGRAILNKEQDPFLKFWEIDLTTRKSRKENSNNIDFDKQREIEKKVSKYIQDNFSFVIIPINSKEKRLELESKIISTISLCEECKPSNNWMGLFSPKEKIKTSGLWLINELEKEQLSDEEIEQLRNLIEKA